MRPAICCRPSKSIKRLVAILTLLLLPAGILLVPGIGHGGALTDLQNTAGSAPNVPMPGNPQIAGSWCPQCKKYYDMPNGKRPSACPHCGFSFVQPAKPKPAPTMPKLKGVDPFGDSLFHDVPIIPDDGKLKTRHFDKDGLAVKAEEWSKEMKQIDAQSRQNQEAQAREFERNKQDLLKSLDASHSNSPAHQQLKNIFGGGEDGWDHPANNPGVRLPDHATVKLLRDPESTGEPLVPKKLSERSLGTLTDQELARRAADNEKEIQTCMGAAKLDIKNEAYNQNRRLGMQDDLAKGQTDMRNTSLDAFTSLGFMSGGKELELKELENWKSGLSVVDKSYALYQDLPEVNHASKDGDWLKGGTAVGDIAVSVAPETIAREGFMANASAWYAAGKGTIGLTAGLYSLYTYGNQNQQLDALELQRQENIRINGEKLKALEEEAQLIKAENDRRAVISNTR